MIKLPPFLSSVYSLYQDKRNMSVANMNAELTTTNPAVEIDSLFRLQLPDDLAQIEELKFVDPLFFTPPFSAPLLSNAMATNQYARKRELTGASQKMQEGPPLKKAKPGTPQEIYFKDGQQTRFRNYQKDQWTERFEELCAFVKVNGHSLVPNSFKENPPLAHWTKRRKFLQQRHDQVLFISHMQMHSLSIFFQTHQNDINTNSKSNRSLVL